MSEFGIISILNIYGLYGKMSTCSSAHRINLAII